CRSAQARRATCPGGSLAKVCSFALPPGTSRQQSRVSFDTSIPGEAGGGGAHGVPPLSITDAGSARGSRPRGSVRGRGAPAAGPHSGSRGRVPHPLHAVRPAAGRRLIGRSKVTYDSAAAGRGRRSGSDETVTQDGLGG